jgi:hypothetical protein
MILQFHPDTIVHTALMIIAACRGVRLSKRRSRTTWARARRFKLVPASSTCCCDFLHRSPTYEHWQPYLGRHRRSSYHSHRLRPFSSVYFCWLCCLLISFHLWLALRSECVDGCSRLAPVSQRLLHSCRVPSRALQRERSASNMVP